MGMAFKISPLNKTHNTLSFPDGTIITQVGIIVESSAKYQAKPYNGVVCIEEIPEKQVVKLQDGTLVLNATGYLYDSTSDIKVDGISGIFKGGIPRYDLTPQEILMAETTGTLLTRVERQS